MPTGEGFWARTATRWPRTRSARTRGVFRDPDVEAGTGAWHVWVGADSDDLWVRVNPTANLSANVRKAEPGKACNVPAKAEVRTGANGLKAVKIGRGQRFTRGQAQQVPKDNHKVVAGSARAGEQELDCVPKCRKCAVLPPTATCKVKHAGQCFVGATPVRCEVANGFELKALAQVCLGERVETFRGSDGSWWEPGGRRLFAASQDRAVWLRQERGDGGWTAVGLIRSRIWLEKQGASRVGARVELKLPEMGASGPFEVVSVEPCPAICAGGGCVVTGVFCHGAGRVFDLWLEGEREPLGVTSGHPIWSADRGAWVPAGALQEGECVQGVNGRVRVLRMAERGDAPVYTLEVDGDHCFRVGEQGILVHNSSPGGPGGGGTGGASPLPASCSCSDRLMAYQQQYPNDPRLFQRIIVAEALGNDNNVAGNHLWESACFLAFDAHVPPVFDTTRNRWSLPVVAVALVCRPNETRFRLYASYNLGRQWPNVRAAAQRQGFDFYRSQPPGPDAEQVIVDECQTTNTQIIAIAASRCICSTCLASMTAAMAQRASPTGRIPRGTCTASGSPNPQAQANCASNTYVDPNREQYF